MSFAEILDNLRQAFSIVNDTSYPTIFTTIGIVLILISAYFSYLAMQGKPEKTPNWRKALLFVFLGIGVVSLGAGGASALLHLFENPFRRVDVVTAIANLDSNKKVQWLMRLIPYDPKKEKYLSISELSTLGPPQLKYVFVAPYDELRGYTVQDAVTMAGGTLEPEERVSAIIFRTKHVYPADVRGLMQVIHKIETAILPSDAKRIIEKDTFSKDQLENLAVEDLNSWSWDKYKQYYQALCLVAEKFNAI